MAVSLSVIKQQLDNHLGERVLIIAQLGRKRTTEYHGVLKSTFPAVFLVKLDQDENLDQISYSYTDILTKNIELDFN